MIDWPRVLGEGLRVDIVARLQHSHKEVARANAPGLRVVDRHRLAAQSTKSFSPGTCTCRSAESIVAAQRRYIWQKRL